MMKKYKFLLTTVDGCVVSFIILSISCVAILYVSMKIGEKWALRPITEQTGIDSWDELNHYMDETFVEGMPREEVYRELQMFGDYKISNRGWVTYDHRCEIIGFPTGNPINYSNLDYVACFSADDTLISWSLHD